MMLIQNITGDFIRSMPVTVVYTLTASLLVSLMLTPYLSSKFLKTNKVKGENRFRKWLNGIIENYYRRTLAFVLRKPGLVIILIVVVFFTSVALVPFVGVSFFPKAEKPQFIININTPKGTNLDETDRAVKYVEYVLNQQPQVAHWAANIGRGNPRIYYNIIPLHERSTHAQLFVILEKYSPQGFKDLVQTLR